MKHSVYLVRALWDDEAKYWVAASDDVPGLATGAETIEALWPSSVSWSPSCWKPTAYWIQPPAVRCRLS
jgi:hypothetical protein